MKELEVNTFNEIEELKLRVYNRTVILANLTKDFGKEAGEEYLGQFSEGEHKQIYLMTQYIKVKGLEVVAKEVTKGLTVQEDKILEEELELVEE